MFTQKLTAEQRLSKAVTAIMANDKYVALAGVLMIGERSIDDNVPTACTNGRDEMYGRAFVESLTDAELRFLVLHECYHKLYQHLTTWRELYKADAKRANMACDYVINLKIADDNADGFAVMPECGLLDRKYHGMNTLQVYKLLPESGEDDGDGDGEGTGFDDHDWDGAQELSDQEQRDLARDIDEAIRQGAMAAGKLGTGGTRDLDELLQPQVDWREVLREFVTTTCTGSDYSTWKRPNRRYRAHGVYLPSGVSEQVDELVVAIDTSGSIGQRELTVFLSEVSSIADTVKPSAVRILYWDTAVCRDEKYEGLDIADIAKSTKPAGGGGTDVTCVPAYMQTHNIAPQAAIILTDGHLWGSWGEWTCPTLWCILDNKNAVADNGVTVHVSTSDM